MAILLGFVYPTMSMINISINLKEDSSNVLREVVRARESFAAIGASVGPLLRMCPNMSSIDVSAAEQHQA